MDPLVLGLVVFSAACFLAFALWPRSSPRGQLDVVRESDDDAPPPSVADTVECLAIAPDVDNRLL